MLPAETPIIKKQLQCQRCGHEWKPIKTEIKNCPKCKSIYWNGYIQGLRKNRPLQKTLINKEDIKDIEYLYLTLSWGAPRIAKKYNCSNNTIIRYLKKYNIKIRPQKEAAALVHKDNTIEDKIKKSTSFYYGREDIIINEYLKYGENCTTVAKKYGCTKATIRRLLKRCNIPLKNRKETLGNKFVGKNNPNYGNSILTGENNVRWLKDRTKLKAPLHEAIRKSKKYIQWRKEIFKRDKYTCIICGVRGKYLEAHHIIKMSNILKTNCIETYEQAMSCVNLWTIGNGVTLCRKCHNMTKHYEEEYVSYFKEVI